MEDVNVRSLFVWMTLTSFDLVIFRMTTTRADLLVLLKKVNVLLLEMTFGKISDSHTRTNYYLSLRSLPTFRNARMTASPTTL
jgi:hypothetical protein